MWGWDLFSQTPKCASPGAWDLNAHLSDRIAPQLPPLLTSCTPCQALRVPSLPGFFQPCSWFPRVAFKEDSGLLKSSCVCLLEGGGFPKGKLWVRPFNKATRNSHDWPFEASRGTTDMGFSCSIVDTNSRMVQPGQTAGRCHLCLVLEKSSPLPGKACCCDRHCRLL